MQSGIPGIGAGINRPPPSTLPNIYGTTAGLPQITSPVDVSGLSGAATSNIEDMLAGRLSPDTINSIRNQAASFGVSSGLPGSDFSGNQGLVQLGLNIEGIKQRGVEDYTTLAGLQSNFNLGAGQIAAGYLENQARINAALEEARMSGATSIQLQEMRNQLEREQMVQQNQQFYQQFGLDQAKLGTAQWEASTQAEIERSKIAQNTIDPTVLTNYMNMLSAPFVGGGGTNIVYGPGGGPGGGSSGTGTATQPAGPVMDYWNNTSTSPGGGNYFFMDQPSGGTDYYDTPAPSTSDYYS